MQVTKEQSNETVLPAVKHMNQKTYNMGIKVQEVKHVLVAGNSCQIGLKLHLTVCLLLET